MTYGSCLGSTQHLKDKHGSGYHLEIKFITNEREQQDKDPLHQVHDFVKEAFHEAVFVEHFGHRVIYKIPSSSVTSLAKSFSSLEEGRLAYYSYRHYYHYRNHYSLKRHSMLQVIHSNSIY